MGTSGFILTVPSIHDTYHPHLRSTVIPSVTLQSLRCVCHKIYMKGDVLPEEKWANFGLPPLGPFILCLPVAFLCASHSMRGANFCRQMPELQQKCSALIVTA